MASSSAACVLLGDTPTADAVAAHLRRVHDRISGTVPGTDDERYNAGSAENVVFAHVTIFHAALRACEALAYRGPPRRLPATERDRYFRELVPFAELMGTPGHLVPDSTAAVGDYYRRIADDYQTIPGSEYLPLRMVGASIRPTGWQDTPLLAASLGLGAGMLVALAAVPGPARRLHGLPSTLDPLLQAGLSVAPRASPRWPSPPSATASSPASSDRTD